MSFAGGGWHNFYGLDHVGGGEEIYTISVRAESFECLRSISYPAIPPTVIRCALASEYDVTHIFDLADLVVDFTDGTTSRPLSECAGLVDYVWANGVIVYTGESGRLGCAPNYGGCGPHDSPSIGEVTLDGTLPITIGYDNVSLTTRAFSGVLNGSLTLDPPEYEGNPAWLGNDDVAFLLPLSVAVEQAVRMRLRARSHDLGDNFSVNVNLFRLQEAAPDPDVPQSGDIALGQPLSGVRRRLKPR